jgi:hypothetical protein
MQPEAAKILSSDKLRNEEAIIKNIRFLIDFVLRYKNECTKPHQLDK